MDEKVCFDSDGVLHRHLKVIKDPGGTVRTTFRVLLWNFCYVKTKMGIGGVDKFQKSASENG